jgi:glycosyltransferase involved in cell wall biosynthesis
MNDAPLNVVFTGNFPYPSGFASTKRMQQYVDYLHEQGVRVSVLVLRGRPPLPGNDAARGDVRGVPFAIVGRDLVAGPSLPLRALRMVRDATRTLRASWRRGSVNILFHYGRPSLENVWLLTFARRIGFRLVHDVVEDPDLVEGIRRRPLYNLKVWTGRRLSRCIPDWSDGLVVISRHLERKYAGFRGPMVLLPIAAAVPPGEPPRDRHDPVRIAYAGTYGAKDGVHVLLEAFQAVRQEFPGCVLRLAGGRSSPLAGVPAAWRGGVEYVGYLDDRAYARFLLEEDILCMTRIDSAYAHAGFPYKLGEYLAAGRPVVASRVGDVADYLRDGEDAVLVAPEDAQALSQALLGLLRDPDRAAAIGANGRRACEEHFNPRKNGEKLLGLLRAVAAADANAGRRP